MRPLNTLSSIALFLIIAFASCKKDNDTAPMSSSIANVTNSITQGKWHITNFSENMTDKTDELKDYTFQFTGSTIFAIKGSEKDTGVWSGKFDNNQLIVHIDFGNSPHVDGLNEDWSVIQANATVLRMTHVDNADDTKTDFVTFEKL